MSAERHIRKLNRLLLAELGENPLYQWIHSESTEFKRAMRMIDEDTGVPLCNYRCPCGLNAQVHSPECLVGGLVVAEPMWETRKVDEGCVDQWVLCCRQERPSEAEWFQLFGTLLPYPQTGSWAPVSTETYSIAIAPGMLPGENYTLAIIRGRQRSREITAADLNNRLDTAEAKRDADRKWKIRNRIQDVLPVSPDPGKRNGNVLIFSEPAEKSEILLGTVAQAREAINKRELVTI